jgi:hypothetical protein
MRHTWNKCRHPWCGPWVTCTMNRIYIGPSVNSMVKSDFHHIWPCVKPFDGKMGQTTVLDWPHVVGVFIMVFRPITTFILTKHSCHSIKSKDTRATNPRTCKYDQWKGFIGFDDVRNDFLLSVFLHLVEGTNYWKCSTWPQFTYPLVHLAKTQKHEHGGCIQFQLSPCFGLHA